MFKYLRLSRRRHHSRRAIVHWRRSGEQGKNPPKNEAGTIDPHRPKFLLVLCIGAYDIVV